VTISVKKTGHVQGPGRSNLDPKLFFTRFSRGSLVSQGVQPLQSSR